MRLRRPKSKDTYLWSCGIFKHQRCHLGGQMWAFRSLYIKMINTSFPLQSHLPSSTSGKEKCCSTAHLHAEGQDGSLLVTESGVPPEQCSTSLCPPVCAVSSLYNVTHSTVLSFPQFSSPLSLFLSRRTQIMNFPCGSPATPLIHVFFFFCADVRGNQITSSILHISQHVKITAPQHTKSRVIHNLFLLQVQCRLPTLENFMLLVHAGPCTYKHFI